MTDSNDANKGEASDCQYFVNALGDHIALSVFTIIILILEWSLLVLFLFHVKVRPSPQMQFLMDLQGMHPFHLKYV